MAWETDDREWLEADGRGGFASGTVCGVRTRRYHGLLLTATSPPTGRMMLVNGMDVWVVTGETRDALSSQLYEGDVRFPDGATRIVAFTHRPWPRWTFRLSDGTTVTQEIFVVRRAGVTVIRWTCEQGSTDREIQVRLFCSGRDYHATHHENASFGFSPRPVGDALVIAPYAGAPPMAASATGTFEPAPDWYRRFLYTAERERGLDCVEDLASPGLFRLRFHDGAASLVLAADAAALGADRGRPIAERVSDWATEEERRRAAIGDPLAQAADAYIVQRGSGATLVAGYPWFTDWGRDTFISLRGLCVSAGRLADARAILLEWAGAVSEGMLPNRFPDRGDAPEFNSVDASLWFIIAAGELEREADRSQPALLGPGDRAALHAAADAILDAFTRGTRYGIRADIDGLLMAGEPGYQLTWMDARIGDWTVTPRIGKPVEIQALWLNALALAAARSPRWQTQLDLGLAAFRARFWNEARGCLFDVIDVDHHPGRLDPAIRPNQVFAMGGLPLPLLDDERARRMLEVVERELLTPMGLRSLAPGEPGYVAHYVGDARTRDASYHQGTVWPWLMGPFVEAWLRVHGHDAGQRDEARRRFLAPLHGHLLEAGLGHVSEIADGAAPFTPRGCPFQAWSIGELIRLERSVMMEPAQASPSEAAPSLVR